MFSYFSQYNIQTQGKSPYSQTKTDAYSNKNVTILITGTRTIHNERLFSKNMSFHTIFPIALS